MASVSSATFKPVFAAGSIPAATLKPLTKEDLAALFERADEVALRTLREHADVGEERAQFKLAVMLDQGKGVKTDEFAAFKLHNLAAEKGLAAAQYNVAWMLAKGRGTQQNERLAVDWYKRAAHQGYKAAHFNLGMAYKNGQGVAPNSEAARGWFESAAKLGDKEADEELRKMGLPQIFGAYAILTEVQLGVLKERASSGEAALKFNLGMMFENGHGVDKHLFEADKWYKAAAAQGYAPAQSALKKLAAQICDEAAASKEKLTQPHLDALYAMGDAEAFHAVKVHAEAGEVNAQNCLGMMCENGRGVAADKYEASDWFRLAAAQGLASAQSALKRIEAETLDAIAQYEGEFTQEHLDTLYAMSESDARVFNIVKRHAEAGEAAAQNCLGRMYQNGRGVEGSDYEAVKWFNLANDQKHLDAGFNLGVMFEADRGIPRGLNEARSRAVNALVLYMVASKGGHVVAPFNLAKLYESSEFPFKRTKKERSDKAIENLKLAATRGYEPAIAELAKRKISFLPSGEKKEEKKAAPAATPSASASPSAPAKKTGGFFQKLFGRKS